LGQNQNGEIGLSIFWGNSTDLENYKSAGILQYTFYILQGSQCVKYHSSLKLLNWNFKNIKKMAEDKSFKVLLLGSF